MSLKKTRGISPPKSLLAIDEPITANDVQSVIADFVLPKSKQLIAPDRPALEKLAGILTEWKNFIYRNNSSRDEWQLLQNAKAKADELNRLLDKLLGLVEPRVINNPNIHFGEKNILSIKAAITANSKISSGLIFLPVANPTKINGWSWLAGVLPHDFETAMRSTNPNISFGIGNDGPVVRFVHAITPLITGEHPPLSSVGRQLKAARRTQN
jgi:hypothetical protein